jgi:hypothetical protein
LSSDTPAAKSEAITGDVGLKSLLNSATQEWPTHVQRHGEDDIDP